MIPTDKRVIEFNRHKNLFFRNLWNNICFLITGIKVIDISNEVKCLGFYKVQQNPELLKEVKQ